MIQKIQVLESNPFFIGIIAVVSFMGGKALFEDIQDNCSLNLNHPFIVFLTLFSIIFLNTKNITVSFSSVIMYMIAREILIETFPKYTKKNKLKRILDNLHDHAETIETFPEEDLIQIKKIIKKHTSY
jgi:hypothetical protein